MSLFRGDASDFYALAQDLSSVGAKAVPALRGGMAQAGKTIERAWRNNAVATSGVHGKHYPDSIDSELVFDLGGVSVDVGPNAAKPQGSMGKGFEFGSRNQPPHLDGAKALAANEAAVEKVVAQALDSLFS